MRDIKFRGKINEAGGSWVKGDLLHRDKVSYIRVASPLGGWLEYQVIPETVGQLTGLKDKNGVEIYGGDIVTYHFENGYQDEPDSRTGKIWWDDECAMFKFDDHEWTLEEVLDDCEVLSNIYENPELLK